MIFVQNSLRSCKNHLTFRSLSTTTSAIKEGWEAVIGIEVHAQINTKTKLFSGFIRNMLP
jgi:aspartyl-tRNA(Asn)/glutamyl-tRNA(Gln) amidotransferase subunit B